MGRPLTPVLSNKLSGREGAGRKASLFLVSCNVHFWCVVFSFVHSRENISHALSSEVECFSGLFQ